MLPDDAPKLLCNMYQNDSRIFAKIALCCRERSCKIDLLPCYPAAEVLPRCFDSLMRAGLAPHARQAQPREFRRRMGHEAALATLLQLEGLNLWLSSKICSPATQHA